jgi:hypothetical protein
MGNSRDVRRDFLAFEVWQFEGVRLVNLGMTYAEAGGRLKVTVKR